MKLQSIFLLGVILLFGFNLAAGQSDGDAKNLYFGYTPRTQQRRQPTTARRPAADTRVSTTVASNNRRGSNRQRTSSGNRRTGSVAVAPTPTGLPGTKITIELMRNGKLSFVKPSYTFRSGDKIRLRMRTNFEGYVTVLNLGSTGAVNLLYPVEGSDNYVTPTMDYQIPQGSGWIVFDRQPGTEIVSVIMSEYELSGLADLDRNSDYFRRYKTSKDLFVQTSGNDFYAVFREQQEPGASVGFTLKLTHK